MKSFPELLAAAQSDHQSDQMTAFDELFRQWNGPVTAFVRARGVDDVEGVVNDVFVKSFSAIDSFQGEESGFRAWLFQIARNRAIDEFRRVGRLPQTVELDSFTIADGDVTDDAERRFSDDRVLALLKLLTDDQREVLTLRVVADMTIDQIAEITGRRRGAVKQLQRRALRRLEKVLESEK